MPQGGPQEIVVWMDAEYKAIQTVRYDDFTKMLKGEERLTDFAASIAQGAYCAVGNGLNVVGAVFFTISIDEDGVLDSRFNVPLQYLVQQAGTGACSAARHVRVASRSRCPVPWHAVHLWQPDVEKAIPMLQSVVMLNELNLEQISGFDDTAFFPVAEDSVTLYDNVFELDEIESLDLTDLVREPIQESFRHSANGTAGVSRGAQTDSQMTSRASSDSFLKPFVNSPVSEPEICSKPHMRSVPSVSVSRLNITPATPSAPVVPPAPSAQEQVKSAEFTARLNDVFGQSGKLGMQELIRLHTSQLEDLKAMHRQEAERQQSSFSDQLREAREEIRELRASLRNEQGRARRLEQLLRSDI